MPAIVFGSIFLLLNGGTVVGCLTDKFKYGYWFTFSLFEFLMIQMVMEWMMRKLSIGEDCIRYLFTLVAVAVVSYAVSLPVVCSHFGDMAGLFVLPLLRYYVYFVAGRLIRVHLNAICAWKWRDAAVAVTLILLFCHGAWVTNAVGCFSMSVWWCLKCRHCCCSLPCSTDIVIIFLQIMDW